MKAVHLLLVVALCVAIAEATSNILNCPSACATNRGICSHGLCLCENGAAGEDCSSTVAELISTKLHSLMHAETANPEPAPVPSEFDDIQFDDEIMAKGGHRRANKRHPLKKHMAAASAQTGGYASGVAGQPAPILPEGVPPCPSNCSGHGNCAPTQNGIGQCKCNPGWTGVDCSSAIECPNNCMGQGDCVNGVCTCYAGFTGSDCSQIPNCRHNCFGHGYCISGHCQCDPGYAGPDCREAMFCAGDCSGHGSCQQGKCTCNSGFYGADCAHKGHDGLGDFCPNSCSGHGNCAQAKCLCFRGYDGHDCGRYAHSEDPLDNVVDASSPRNIKDSTINTGDDTDPNYALWKGTATGQPANSGAPVNPADAGEAASRVNKTVAANAASAQGSFLSMPVKIQLGPYPAPSQNAAAPAAPKVNTQAVREAVEESPAHKNNGHHHHQAAAAPAAVDAPVLPEASPAQSA